MTIYENIKSDINVYRKAKNSWATTVLSTMAGEIERSASKNATDTTSISLIKKTISNLKELPQTMETEDEIDLLSNYVPEQLDEVTLGTIFEDKKFGSIKDWMAHLKENYSGQYDGKLASAVFNSHFVKSS